MIESQRIWQEGWQKAHHKLWHLKGWCTGSLVHWSWIRWLKAKKLRRQMKPTRIKGAPRSDLVARVVFFW